MAPLECGLALGMVAAETRMPVAAQQAASNLPRIGVEDSLEEQRLQTDHASKMQKVSNFQLCGPAELTGSADFWYIDDGDILCHPILVPSYLQEFDDANDKVGAERNPHKTDVVYHGADLDATLPE